MRKYQGDSKAQQEAVLATFGLKLIFRSRENEHGIARYRRLIERERDRASPRDLLVEEPEFLRIHSDESVVVVSPDSK